MARNFCGVVDFNTCPNPLIANQMADKLDFNRLYHQRHISLSNARFVNLYSKNFPVPEKSEFLEQFKDRYTIVSFSMFIRLDEWVKKMNENLDLAQVSDDEIILRSYMKWGKDLVHHLEGDWAFAIYDAVEQELFLARNPHADGTVFYYHQGDRVFFASMLTGLVHIQDIPMVLDKEKFFLENLTISGIASKTIYENIHFLLPGHFISVKKNSFQLCKYWKPFELPKTRYSVDEDYFVSLRETLENAVVDRLSSRNQWGFALSGGLDSSAVAGVASRYFGERSEKLRALCYVPMDSGFKKYASKRRFGDESEFAKVMAKHDQNIDLELVSKNGPLWDHMADYARDFGTPPHIANNWFADVLSQNFAEKEMGFAMIAQGGNHSISYLGESTYRNFSQLIFDIRNGLSLTPSSLPMALGKSAFGTGKLILRELFNKKTKRFDEMIKRWTFLQPEFVDRIHGYSILEQHFYGNDDKLTSGEVKMRKTLGIGRHCRLGLWNQIGAKHDVVYVDPTRDRRLLELLISFPNHIFNRNGEPKFLYKHSFNKLVPSEVMHNKRMGFSMSDTIPRYQNDFESFKRLLAKQRSSSLLSEMIDFERIDRYYHDLLTSVDFTESDVLDVIRKNGSVFHALFTEVQS